MQEKCRNRHPPDARKVSETIAAQQSSTKQDRAAAWRAHNAATQHGQQEAPSSKEQPLWRTSDGQQNFQSGKPLDAQSATAVQHAIRESTEHPLAQGFSREAPKLPSANIASPSCEAADPSVNEDPSDCEGEPAGLSSAPARKKLSYARLGPAGQCLPSGAPVLLHIGAVMLMHDSFRCLQPALSRKTIFLVCLLGRYHICPVLATVLLLCSNCRKGH